MRLKYRGRHKEAIKHDMYELYKYKTNPRPELYALLIEPGSYGFSFALDSNKGTALVGYIMIFFSTIGHIMQRLGIKRLKKQGYALEWLSILDQTIIFIYIVLSSIIINIESQYSWTFLLPILASIYASYKVSRNCRPYWRLYFFRSARTYFRELKTYARLSK